MKRKIIKIDEEKCNGCGMCATGCPEGAIQMVNAKAHLVGELLCDGLGACIGSCPAGAITIEEREAEPYDERQVMDNILAKGPDVLAAHLAHLAGHGQHEYMETAKEVLKEKGIKIPNIDSAGKGFSSVIASERSERSNLKKGDCFGPSGLAMTKEKGLPMANDVSAAPNDHFGHSRPHGGGCPGSMMKDMRKPAENDSAGNRHACSLQSELGQWPIQLKLLNPHAPYLNYADLVVAADCVPFAYADFHGRFLKGKILTIFCPKLDDAREEYVEKLAEIFKANDIKSISVTRMEVPCCGGTTAIVEEAIQKSGKRMTIKEYTISLQGEIV